MLLLKNNQVIPPVNVSQSLKTMRCESQVVKYESVLAPSKGSKIDCHPFPVLKDYN